jgi:hypothetical protein
MNAIQRFISKLVPAPPACDHEAELQSLRAARDAFQANHVALSAKYVALKHRLASLEKDQDELVKENVHLLMAICDERHVVGDNTEAVEMLRSERAEHAQALSDLAGRIEEANSRVAMLEQRLREKGIPLCADGQTELAVTGGEASTPPAADEVIYDKVLKLAFGLVGVFFDEGKHHWLLQRGPEKVKVPIKDKAFLDRIKRGEQSFRAGDALLVKVHTITRRAAKPDHQVYVEYVSIDEVVSLVHADENIPLGEFLAEETEVADALAR